MPYTAPTAVAAIGITYSFSGVTAKVHDVSFGGLKCETKEVTNQASASGWKEFIAGLKEAGTVTLKSEFDGSLPTLGTAGDLAITFPFTAPKVWTLHAILSGYKPDGKLGDAMTADVTFQITGVPAVA